jgi:hypothetical protein
MKIIAFEQPRVEAGRQVADDTAKLAPALPHPQEFDRLGFGFPSRH